jgi:hypothetical protein
LSCKSSRSWDQSSTRSRSNLSLRLWPEQTHNPNFRQIYMYLPIWWWWWLNTSAKLAFKSKRSSKKKTWVTRSKIHAPGGAAAAAASNLEVWIFCHLKTRKNKLSYSFSVLHKIKLPLKALIETDWRHQQLMRDLEPNNKKQRQIFCRLLFFWMLISTTDIRRSSEVWWWFPNIILKPQSPRVHNLKENLDHGCQ